MLKSSFRLALRNFLKRKTSSAINILSLSAGFAAAVLVTLFCRSEFDYDKGFAHNNDIYRVTSTFNDGSTAPTTALPYFKYLKSEIPEITEVSRLDAPGATVIQLPYQTNAVPFSVDNGYRVDPSFFSIFSFHFLHGTAAAAFKEPNTIVLSEKLARQLFGSSYPLGHMIKPGGTAYKVTGVFKNDFLNHFKADFFSSMNSDGLRERIVNAVSWVTDPNYYTYLRLRPGSDTGHVIKELNAYTQRHAAADMKATGTTMTNSLQALPDIHLHSAQYQSALEARQGNIRYLYILVTIAVVILLLGCINYINLATAQAIDRAREVGVRRVLGAGKAAIRLQFLIETLLISFAALFSGLLAASLCLPVFNRLTGQDLSFFDTQNLRMAGWLITITLLTGTLAGIYPAFYLSGFKPVKVLKGKVADSLSLLSFRKILIVIQFAVATCLLFATLVMKGQLHFLMNAKPGFDQDQQLLISLGDDGSRQNSAYYMKQLLDNPDFISVTAASGPLVSGDMNLYPADKTVNARQDIFLNLTSENYAASLGLQFVSGHNFTPVIFTNKNTQEDTEVHDIGRQVVLNVEAAKALGLNPYTAPGKQLSHLHNGVVYHYTIAGVVKNYHYFSLHSTIGPCAIMPVNPIRYNTIIAKVNGRQLNRAIAHAQKTWKQLNAAAPFSYDFLDKLFKYDYEQDNRQQQVAGVFSMVAVLISCLGLLGLITYSVTQKAKEIGIRKVTGASAANIVALFSKQYLQLVLAANLIALPLAWYMMDRWLWGFPYRTGISWQIFAIPLLAGLLTTLLTITFKTVRAAMANPVKSLRAE